LENTYDIDFQHQFRLNKRNEIIWGLEQRLVEDSLIGSLGTSFNQLNRLHHRSGAFIQDKITLIPDHLHVTLGSKFEVNSFTGFEIQPSARASWVLNNRHAFWAAISRAVRTPSRAEDSVRNNISASPGPVLVSQFGTLDLESEELTAFEIGHRFQPKENFSLDIAAFFNNYDNLVSQETGTAFLETSPVPSHTTVPITAANLGSGDTYGVEISAKWIPFDWWRLDGSVSWFEMDLSRDSGSNDTTINNLAGNDPEFQGQLHSYWNLLHNIEFDAALFFVDALEGLNVPSYTRFDLRLGWKPVESLELSIVGQNLLDPEHPEFATETLSTGTVSQPQRSVYGKATWKF
jgi:iron complex outermembrane receptor protein